MKCCFCGAELDCVRTLGGRAEYWMCQNTKSCPAEDFVGNKEIWQALIDGKKAQDALKVAHKSLLSIAYSGRAEAPLLRTCAKKSLKEIASITTQDKE